MLCQPTDDASFYVSYGTSFNTSGELYQYDDQTGRTRRPRRASNLELGAKLDLFDGSLSARVAAFHVDQVQRAQPRLARQCQPIVDFLLSGKRHAAGLELDLAGRITPAWEVFVSYAWIPWRQDRRGAPGVGAERRARGRPRPSLTPRHSGTIWSRPTS